MPRHCPSAFPRDRCLAQGQGHPNGLLGVCHQAGTAATCNSILVAAGLGEAVPKEVSTGLKTCLPDAGPPHTIPSAQVLWLPLGHLEDAKKKSRKEKNAFRATF